MTFGLFFCPSDEAEHLPQLLQFFHKLLYMLHVYFFCHLHAEHVNVDCNRCNTIRYVSSHQFRRSSTDDTNSYTGVGSLKNEYRRFFFHHCIEWYRDIPKSYTDLFSAITGSRIIKSMFNTLLNQKASTPPHPSSKSENH